MGPGSLPSGQQGRSATHLRYTGPVILRQSDSSWAGKDAREFTVGCLIFFSSLKDRIQSCERFFFLSHFKLMTVPALVHQMPFTGSVSGTKRKMTGTGGRHGWHLTTPKHRMESIFLRDPEC